MTEDFDENPFGALITVSDVDEVAAVPSDAQGLLVRYPSDELLSAIARQLREVRHILADGNAQRITDRGVAALRSMHALESLDLEYSAVTDAALDELAKFSALRWVDLGSTPGVSVAALQNLRSRRPDLEIESDEL